MTVHTTIRELKWDSLGNGTPTTLSVEYTWDTEMDTLTIDSVCHAGLEWIDYLKPDVIEHIRNRISERLEND
jgi:hypothetical protein